MFEEEVIGTGCEVAQGNSVTIGPRGAFARRALGCLAGRLATFERQQSLEFRQDF
jgi:hypothetical protein